MKLISRTRPEAATQPIEWLHIEDGGTVYKLCRYYDSGKPVRVVSSSKTEHARRGTILVTRALDMDGPTARRVIAHARIHAPLAA